MATNSNWTVVFDDKTILKQTGDGSGNSYTIDNNSFWNQSKFSNIWAIQYADANIGDFQTQFIDKWDSAHLTRLQSDWDNNNVDGESNSEKITRLGAKPTSYSS